MGPVGFTIAGNFLIGSMTKPGQKDPRNLPAEHAIRKRKRDKRQRQRDRVLVSKLYFRDGMSYQRIAETLNNRDDPDRDYMISRKTIKLDVDHVLKNWVQGQSDPDVWVDEEIFRYYMVEQESWNAWERSKRPKERTVTKEGSKETVRGDMSYEEVQTLKEEQVGNPVFLDKILECIEGRGRIRGLYIHKVKIEADIEHSVKTYITVSPSDWDNPAQIRAPADVIDVTPEPVRELPHGSKNKKPSRL